MTIIKSLLDTQGDKKWHVIYVHARHEKQIHLEMLKMGLESLLPMKKELHTWCDRKKWVDVPLFSSYVFINMPPGEKELVYLLNGFVKFVSTNGKPCIVPQWQIDGIKKILNSYPELIDVLDSDYVGVEGTILVGPLAGIHGKITEVKNQKCFTMRIDGIERVLSVTIPASLFKPFSEVIPRRLLSAERSFGEDLTAAE